MMDKKIAFILPFYGKLPVWFDVFILSCSFNPSLTWLIFTDLVYSDKLPKNVIFKKLNKQEISQLIYERTGIKHELPNPHKLCDFKPLYGYVFENYLADYDYWGHCDMDIIWGNITAFLTKIKYEDYDIVSTRKNAISGHFTLYKNEPDINMFFKSVPNYQKAFTDINYQGFDEGFFSYHLFNEVEKKHANFNIFWPDRNSIDRMELELKPNGWYWEQGEIKNKSGLTGTYLHMIDWKKSLEEVQPTYAQNHHKFYINKYGIWNLVPLKIRIKAFFNSGIRYRIRYNVDKLKRFIKYKILGKSEPKIKANVIDGYRVIQ